MIQISEKIISFCVELYYIVHVTHTDERNYFSHLQILCYGCFSHQHIITVPTYLAYIHIDNSFYHNLFTFRCLLALLFSFNSWSSKSQVSVGQMIANGFFRDGPYFHFIFLHNESNLNVIKKRHNYFESEVVFAVFWNDLVTK